MGMNQYKKIAECLSSAHHLVIFSGAGMSTSSGLPDFRSSQGLWSRYNPMALASIDAMENNREAFLDFYRYRINALKNASPNLGHCILSKWEEENLLQGIITQNVDGFHQEAGCRNVVELHGTLRKARCSRCKNEFPSELLLTEELCPDCKGILRPGVVLFGEMLPDTPMKRAHELSLKSDVFMVLGSSLNVSPANFFPLEAHEAGAKLIILNREPTQYDSMASFVVRENLVDALERIQQIMHREGGH
jgi:NAD-dependent deacetylase